MRLDEDPSCKLCRSPSSYIGFTHNGSSKTTILSIYKCEHCGLVFVGNEIDNDELSVAYSKLDPTPYYEEIEETERAKFDDTIADLAKLVKKTDAILDIGTGDGAFAKMLLQRGFSNVAVHEVPGMDLSALEARGCTTYKDFDYNTIPSDSFDAVTLLDVAEHVIDPVYLFQSCNRILKRGGVVYFHSPVVTRTDTLMHRLQALPGLNRIGRAWQTGRTSIYHLQNYTPTAIRLLFDKTEFQTEYVRVENELSWPVATYVRIYVCEKQGLPSFLAPVIAPFAWPFLATDFFNPNKGIACGRKA